MLVKTIDGSDEVTEKIVGRTDTGQAVQQAAAPSPGPSEGTHMEHMFSGS